MKKRMYIALSLILSMNASVVAEGENLFSDDVINRIKMDIKETKRRIVSDEMSLKRLKNASEKDLKKNPYRRLNPFKRDIEKTTKDIALKKAELILLENNLKVQEKEKKALEKEREREFAFNKPEEATIIPGPKNTYGFTIIPDSVSTSTKLPQQTSTSSILTTSPVITSTLITTSTSIK